MISSFDWIFCSICAVDFFVCAVVTTAGIVGSRLISISVLVFFATVADSSWFDPFVSVDVFLIEGCDFFSSTLWRTSDDAAAAAAAVSTDDGNGVVGVSLRERLFEVFIRGLDGKRGTGETGGESKCWDFEKPPPRVDELYLNKQTFGD